MKQMKIVKKIMAGSIGTIALTSFILFALDAYPAGKAALYQSLQPNGSTEKNGAGSHPDAALAENTPEDAPSIGTSERHMLYQPQEASSSQKTSTKAVTESSTSDAQAGQVASDQKQSDKASASKNKNGHASDKKNSTFQTVTEDYFSDALFIGDSRTVGMLQSRLLPDSCYYAKTGIGIGDILSERIVNEGGVMLSVAEALSRHSFGKVYIMIGINDISRGDVDWFLEQYQEILDTVAQTQPEAIVYIQSNIPMSYGTQDLNGALNNKNLALRNEASSTLADSKTVFYLDISQVFADANGNLASLYTKDGLHVASRYYPLWVDYLLHHAIVRD